MKEERIITTNESIDDTMLEYYLEVDPNMANPYDIFFSDEELILLREYAALFITLWKNERGYKT
jgi:hypothetical protein